jgi:hypothetical protein
MDISLARLRREQFPCRWFAKLEDDDMQLGLPFPKWLVSSLQFHLGKGEPSTRLRHLEGTEPCYINFQYANSKVVTILQEMFRSRLVEFRECKLPI